MSQSSDPLQFDIGGMHCAACSARIERVLSRVPGIAKASVNLATAKANIWPTPDAAANLSEQIMAHVTRIGFTAKPSELEDAASHMAKDKAKAEAVRKTRLMRLIPMTIFTIPLLIVSMGHMLGIPLPAWLEPHQSPKAFILTQFFLTLPVVWLGRHFYIDGLTALWRKSPNMDSLVAVGTGAAFLYSVVTSVLGLMGSDPAMRAMNLYYESCAVLLTMIEFGQFLEFTAKRKASDAMGALMSLTPETALLVTDNGQPAEVPVIQVKVGDRLLVRPGSRIPVDGKVLEGNSAVDLSLLTGESMPVPVAPGADLVAGSVNGEGSLVMEAVAVGQNTRLSRIARMVADAQGSKAPIARLADKVSYYFVPAVMLFALCSGLMWLIFSSEPATVALNVFVAVLVMACPCAMGLATPMSIMVGTGRGARLGVLIKNGPAMEQAASITVLCVDKTGTLTTGKPALTAIYPVSSPNNVNEDELLAMAAALESRSEHPLALAITDAAVKRNCPSLEVSDVEVNPGLGIAGNVTFNGQKWLVAIGNEAFMAASCIEPNTNTREKLAALAKKGQTPLLLALTPPNGCPTLAAILALADQLRPETQAVVAKLKEMKIKVVMLTGDNVLAAEAIAKQAGIDRVAAQLLPAQKADYVHNLQMKGHVVGMVGDGINDAPALALANVGLAVGTGVDVSAEAGDIVLMQGGMTAVLQALGLSRATMRNIKQNLGWAFGYNILGLPIAGGLLHVFGGPMLSPMLAGTAMALSSFSVVTNALRLRRYKANVNALPLQ